MSEVMQMKVYGAWKYRGVWDGCTTPPVDGWKLIDMQAGRYDVPPLGYEPGPGEVTLLMQGDHCLVVTPWRAGMTLVG